METNKKSTLGYIIICLAVTIAQILSSIHLANVTEALNYNSKVIDLQSKYITDQNTAIESFIKREIQVGEIIKIINDFNQKFEKLREQCNYLEEENKILKFQLEDALAKTKPTSNNRIKDPDLRIYHPKLEY